LEEKEPEIQLRLRRTEEHSAARDCSGATTPSGDTAREPSRDGSWLMVVTVVWLPKLPLKLDTAEDAEEGRAKIMSERHNALEDAAKRRGIVHQAPPPRMHCEKEATELTTVRERMACLPLVAE